MSVSWLVADPSAHLRHLLRAVLMRTSSLALCVCFELGSAALLGHATAPRSTSRLAASVDMKLADDGVLGVGVIGAGRIGLVHLEALSRCESAKAVIISNPTVSKAEAAAAKFKLDQFTGDAMEVINNPEVEAVWICSPSQFHADQIKACAAAGKHVFCGAPPAPHRRSHAVLSTAPA